MEPLFLEERIVAEPAPSKIQVMKPWVTETLVAEARIAETRVMKARSSAHATVRRSAADAPAKTAAARRSHRARHDAERVQALPLAQARTQTSQTKPGDASARGRGSRPSLHSDRVHKATDGELKGLLTNGNLARGMPSWSRLPEAQRWQIVRYLRTLSVDEAPVKHHGR